MNKGLKIIKDHKGVTLVELLATIIIVGIVGALAFSVLFQGYSNYQRIKVESELRDEADLIMASMVKDLFVLKKSQISLKNQCTSGVNNSFIEVKKPGAVAGTTEIYKTGFENGKVIVKDKEVSFYNNIKLLKNDCTALSPTVIKKKEDTNAYTIIFTLETMKDKTMHSMKFENTITIIDDSREVRDE
ncbi:prepilin-type N-terminal cleavage/methylation domain-containing protein [Microbacterium sp. APC 3898]|uniref:Prepilin-type N-terminal cleavage/methylation domain-containing protein n=2 Tax=Planococcus TaxID=1372 RepID=A0ABT7ZIH4_9BACL|nr:MULTISPECIES: prepilin-type N-terminal cleavage/methylation domain-containing protein [Terrabacteria group]MBD8015827.1 prepilin-type N-terminal cleavage/methylation domain-containing protein [Planococcus wigleyi]MDN3426945.1 prepilin-type N-terminal cleavage/methylation domain-containing protein [Planococcus sp. APC 4016]MDN3438201.1 prepilin-type N-terminal cleavage/methylation domain-containing protein [Planococcus sp. APC 3900]MDN3499907.1 prepilin-type N-terminal cleavage/methylation do